MIKTLFAAMLALPVLSHAVVINHTLTWSGSGGYSMTGEFSYDDINAGDGAIRDTEVISLALEGFLNGVSQGSNPVNTALPNFNFNFNTTTGQFFLGGNGAGPFGQNWNFRGNGIGFSAGGGASTMSIGNQFVGFANNPSNLTAQQVVVPAPATWWLMLLGVAGVLRLTRAKAEA